ncbi:MAG TPA: GDP-mannose 4,6-dehydratase [Bacteroidales bacterium]|nr:GDP-mannose 4,6-dehydratase [Bacteroidales bacterium]
MQTILITGAAGFIGSNLTDKLLNLGFKVIGIDNFDDFYAREIKQKNISDALSQPNFRFIESDICSLHDLFKILPADINAIIHLAAKAGVRSSILYPEGYEENNITGITRALELSVKLNIPRFIFASSSSIYGSIKRVPFIENETELNPLNPYAKSKLISEQIGKEFSEKYDLRFISLRLFSVYGPRLRPDLIMTKIAQSLLNNKPLQILGNGDALRDFTYIDDIVDGVIKALSYDGNLFDIFNLGYGNPVSLIDIIKLFEEKSGQKITLNFLEKVKGESEMTWADISKARRLLGFHPGIDINTGIGKFLTWYDRYGYA